MGQKQKEEEERLKVGNNNGEVGMVSQVLAHFKSPLSIFEKGSFFNGHPLKCYVALLLYYIAYVTFITL